MLYQPTHCTTARSTWSASRQGPWCSISLRSVSGRSEPRVERVRLYVDGQTRAVYRKLGFGPTEETVPVENDSFARGVELAVTRPEV